MPPIFLNRIFCPHCSKSFVSQRSRTTHIHIVHSNQRVSQCEPDQSDQSDHPTSDDGEEDLHGAYPDGGFANPNPKSANQSPEPPDRRTAAPWCHIKEHRKNITHI